MVYSTIQNQNPVSGSQDTNNSVILKKSILKRTQTQFNRFNNEEMHQKTKKTGKRQKLSEYSAKNSKEISFYSDDENFHSDDLKKCYKSSNQYQILDQTSFLKVYISEEILLKRQQLNILKLIGIKIVQNIENDYQVYITRKMSKDFAFLKAINKNCTILSESWLISTLDQKQKEPFESHCITDESFQTTYNFNLKQAQAQVVDSQSGFLTGFKFILLGNSAQKSDLEILIKSANGKIVNKKPQCLQTEIILVLNKIKDAKIINSYISENIRIYNIDLILEGCLYQKIDLNNEKYYFRD